MPNSGFTGFDDLVDADGIAVDVTAIDKADLLAMLADRAAAICGIDTRLILERVQLREKLGSTGFGGGAAIPHARFAELTSVVVLVAVLSLPVAFAALDDQPVDIVVLLLSPEAAGAEHLKALARISRTLRDPARLAALRGASDADAVIKALYIAAEAPRQAA